MKQLFFLSVIFCSMVACDNNKVPFTPDGAAAGDTTTPLRDLVIGEDRLDQTAQDSWSNPFDGTLPDDPVLGIYTITGTDAAWGSYTGKAEVRLNTFGQYIVHHVQLYDSAAFEGDKIALAWEGEIHSQASPYLLTVHLDRIGFINKYLTDTREGTATEPLLFKGELATTSPKVLAGTLTAQNGSGESFTETWTWVSPNGKEPIWHNQRQLLEAHAPLSQDQKNLINNSFGSFHALENVQPYVNRPEFQEAMHFYVFDPTDFNFYQDPTNQNVLRVIQKVIDPISLVETRLRNRAYRQTLAAKASYYDNRIPQFHLVGPNYNGDPTKPSGVVSYYVPTLPPDQRFAPNGDGLEWTGDYVTAQSYRYLVTGEQAALDNMLRALRGIFVCYEIAPTPGDFARTLRVHLEDGNSSWHQGASPYQGFDWMEGANNDMMKGFLHGFTAAYFALKKAGGHEAEIEKMIQITSDLLSNSSIAGDWQGNEAMLRLFLYMADNDLGAKLKYELIFAYLKIWMIDWGNGSTYEMGISDWSGNYMNLKALIHYLEIEQYLQNNGSPMAHIAEFQGALKTALERMRNTRLGFYQLTAGILGNFATPPPEIEDALWVLREFPAPKVAHFIDWRINPEFCLSPVPNLPWKFDWTSPEEDRSFSLTVYPLFERPTGSTQWKELPGTYTDGESQWENFGVDFLHAYWFGRYYGKITATN